MTGKKLYDQVEEQSVGAATFASGVVTACVGQPLCRAFCSALVSF